MNTQPTETKTEHADGHLEVVSIWDTIQGEGPASGCPAVFVRLAGCNLQCSYCDTDYTSNRAWLAPDELCGRVKGIRPSGLVVLTGGEPLRQNIGPFIRLLIDAGYHVQIETNGTLFQKNIPWTHPCLSIVCSPKTTKLNLLILSFIDAYKYVIETEYVSKEDGLPCRVLGSQFNVARPHVGYLGDVYIQPMDAKEQNQNLWNVATAVGVCKKHDYRLSVQIQKLIGLE